MVTTAGTTFAAPHASAAPPPDPAAFVRCTPDARSAATIDAFVEAYNRQDAAAAEAFTTNDFTRYSVTTPAPMPRPQWRQMWEGFVDAFPDERWEVQSVTECGDAVTVRVVERGTFLRPWVFPDGHVAEPTGRDYRADSVIVFRLDDARRISSYVQFTTPAFLEVGVTPATLAAIVRNGF